MRLTRTNILGADREIRKSRGYISIVMLTLTACATTSAPMVDRISEQPPKICEGQEVGCQRQPTTQPQLIGSAPEQMDLPLEPIDTALDELPIEPLIAEAPKLIPTRYPGITLVDGLSTRDSEFLTAFTPTAKAFKFKAGDRIPLAQLEEVFGKLDRTKPTIILVGRESCVVSQHDEKAMKQSRLSRMVNTLVFMEGHTNRESPVKELLFDGAFNCPTVILLDKTGTVVLLTEEIVGSHGYSKKFAAAVREVIEQK